jgi:hypothetical protein
MHSSTTKGTKDTKVHEGKAGKLQPPSWPFVSFASFVVKELFLRRQAR